MFKRIFVPVDLAHKDGLVHALTVAANMAKLGDGEVVYLGVHASAPSPTAHTSVEYAARLDDFAAEQARAHQIRTSALPVLSHDPVIDLAPAIVAAAEDNDADLIVMASHVPGWVEHIFHSNAGYVACHAGVSVFVVR